MHLISYADQEFSKAQKIQSLRAIELGFNRVAQFAIDDLAQTFCEKNAETLSMKRGAGYWIWKPAILLDYVISQKEEAKILYLDSGCLPKLDQNEYDHLIQDDRIHLWTIGVTPIRLWTDPRVLKDLGIAEKLWETPMVWAGAILGKNSKIFIEFCQLWQDLCDRPEFLRPETLSGYLKTDDVIWHRHDQSLLSLIVIQHPEWFVVHLDGTSDMNWDAYFDRHRNVRLKYKLIIMSHPDVRIFRQRIVNRMPQKLRVFLREIKANLEGKKLSANEKESMRKFY